MKNKRTLQQLTLKDNFLFTEVMSNPEICKGFLERVLQIPIDHVEVYTETTMTSHPDFKGIRLDVYAKDNKGTHFNVEMQVIKDSIEKRARYYHCQMDRFILKTGKKYEELPDCYVIFICDWDPFYLEKYCYTVSKSFKEVAFDYDDGSRTIFLSTKGKNQDEVTPQLVSFLNFVAMDLDESKESSDDPFIKQIQDKIEQIKHDEEVDSRFMSIEEMMEIERNKAKEEGIQAGIFTGKIDSILDILSDLGEVSAELANKIKSIQEMSKLSAILKAASKAQSISEFEEATKEIIK